MRAEISTVTELINQLEVYDNLEHVVIHGLDLTDFTDEILSVSSAHSVYLGCKLDSFTQVHIVESGGVIFPDLEGIPYKPYRSKLYTVDELMEGYQPGNPESFNQTTDGKIYHHYTELRHYANPVPIVQALAQRLHDHSMDRSLMKLLGRNGEHKQVVGVMGGHALLRNDPTWRNVAIMAWKLARKGYFIATGGGPGAMEAANLGAWMSKYKMDELSEVMDLLSQAPSWRNGGWFETARLAKEKYPHGAESLGVPTWFYGHEPTNFFASYVAKYFANSLREDKLLAIAYHGIVYTPGSAGTIQEIFQDATQNHYGTFRMVSPMVFLGTSFWMGEKPVFPLLDKLAESRQYASMMLCTDDIDQLVDFIQTHPPVLYKE